MKQKIDKVIKYKEKLYDRVFKRLEVELKRQKESGKKFITDSKIDSLIDKIIKDELARKT